MSRRAPTVVLSPEPWESLPTNKHQLSRRLAPLGDVLYVDVNGQALRDLLRERKLRTPALVSPGLWVAAPPVLPKRWRTHSSAMLRINAWLTNAFIAITVRRLGWRHPTVFAYFPPVIYGLSLLRARAVLYHCVDHYPSFPDWAALAPAMLTAEGRLATRADVVIATSPGLVKHCRRWRSDVRFLGNVADVALFKTVRPARQSGNELPARQRVAVFHGALSTHKIDFAFLAATVSSGALDRLTLIGPATTPEAALEIERLERTGRVDHHPQCTQEDVIPFLDSADVLLLPYKIGEHTSHVFPLKLVEYLATGKPILSTRLPSVVDFAGDAIVYAESNDVGRVLAAFTDSSEESGRRVRLSEGNSWDDRVRDVIDIVDGSRR